MTIDFDRMIDRRNSDSLKWSGPSGSQTIPMWVTDMDFATPECVMHALRKRVDQGVLGYPVVTDEVTGAVVAWAESHYRWRIEPEWLVWLPGLVPGIHLARRTLAEPEDEILTFVPAYPPFLSVPGMTGRASKTVPLTRENARWTPDLDQFRKAIGRRTKVLLFCNPRNPVGRVFGREALAAVAEVCERHGLIPTAGSICPVPNGGRTSIALAVRASTSIVGPTTNVVRFWCSCS